MNLGLGSILVVVALVAFALAGIGWTWRKTDLIAVGLALWALSELLGRMSGITVSTLVLFLAFVTFVATAAGWRYRKLNMVAAGLALWMLSLLLP